MILRSRICFLIFTVVITLTNISYLWFKNNLILEFLFVFHFSEISKKLRDKAELRSLWKKAINQQILLIRMEKENAKLYGNPF